MFMPTNSSGHPANSQPLTRVQFDSASADAKPVSKGVSLQEVYKLAGFQELNHSEAHVRAQRRLQQLLLQVPCSGDSDLSCAGKSPFFLPPLMPMNLFKIPSDSDFCCAFCLSAPTPFQKVSLASCPSASPPQESLHDGVSIDFPGPQGS